MNFTTTLVTWSREIKSKWPYVMIRTARRALILVIICIEEKRVDMEKIIGQKMTNTNNLPTLKFQCMIHEKYCGKKFKTFSFEKKN
jgi:hypothetical protein